MGIAKEIWGGEIGHNIATNFFVESAVSSQTHKNTHSPTTGRLCKEGEFNSFVVVGTAVSSPPLHLPHLHPPHGADVYTRPTLQNIYK